MVPVVQPAKSPNGVGRAAARMRYETRDRSVARPLSLSGSLRQGSIAAARPGEATYRASRNSGVVTMSSSWRRS